MNSKNNTKSNKTNCQFVKLPCKKVMPKSHTKSVILSVVEFFSRFWVENYVNVLLWGVKFTGKHCYVRLGVLSVFKGLFYLLVRMYSFLL